MTEKLAYQFRGERVEAALADAARVVTVRELEERAGLEEGDLEDAWYDLVPDVSESVLLLTELKAAEFANRVVSGDFGLDLRHGAWHAEALQRLSQHDDCDQVIDELIAQRDDVVASIMYARNYCFNDISQGEYGDLHVDAESFLYYLRPTMRGDDTYRRLDLQLDHCPQCDSTDFDHADECTALEEAETLTARRQEAIATHRYCVEMAQALIDHIGRCIVRTEEIAHCARRVMTEVEGVVVVDPHAVLSSIRLEDLNPHLEPRTPTLLAIAIQPALEDADYCDEGEPYHSEPHRACRYLVS